jgi:hypothetical protein
LKPARADGVAGTWKRLEIIMKSSVFLSTFVAGLLVASLSFAQNFGAYAQSYGDARYNPPLAVYPVPTGAFTRSDLAYQAPATTRAVHRRHGRTAEPAPAQER